MTRRKTKPRTQPDAKLLTMARQRKGYTQQQIAIVTGVALRHYQRVENGERPFSALSMQQGLAICMLLDIDPLRITFPEENFAITTDSR